MWVCHPYPPLCIIVCHPTPLFASLCVILTPSLCIVVCPVFVTTDNILYSANFWWGEILTDNDFPNIWQIIFWWMVTVFYHGPECCNVLNIWQVKFWQSGWKASKTPKFPPVKILSYRIAENVGGRKHWRIKLSGLFGGENIGEWSFSRSQPLYGFALLKTH